MKSEKALAQALMCLIDAAKFVDDSRKGTLGEAIGRLKKTTAMAEAVLARYKQGKALTPRRGGRE